MSNLTNTELQGSSTVFYCVPRNWIRLLKRTGQFFRILLSYPLYLVFWDSEVLKAGAPHLQILLLNLFLYYVPCALVMIMVSASRGPSKVFMYPYDISLLSGAVVEYG